MPPLRLQIRDDPAAMALMTDVEQVQAQLLLSCLGEAGWTLSEVALDVARYMEPEKPEAASAAVSHELRRAVELTFLATRGEEAPPALSFVMPGGRLGRGDRARALAAIFLDGLVSFAGESRPSAVAHLANLLSCDEANVEEELKSLARHGEQMRSGAKRPQGDEDAAGSSSSRKRPAQSS